MAWASKKVSTRLLLRNWMIVYAGNLAGSMCMVAMILLSGYHLGGHGQTGVNMVSIAVQKCSHEPVQAFVLGILCNILVCLAVWLSFSAATTTGKILSVIFPHQRLCGSRLLTLRGQYVLHTCRHGSSGQRHPGCDAGRCRPPTFTADRATCIVVQSASGNFRQYSGWGRTGGVGILVRVPAWKQGSGPITIGCVISGIIQTQPCYEERSLS